MLMLNKIELINLHKRHKNEKINLDFKKSLRDEIFIFISNY